MVIGEPGAERLLCVGAEPGGKGRVCGQPVHRLVQSRFLLGHHKAGDAIGEIVVCQALCLGHDDGYTEIHGREEGQLPGGDLVVFKGEENGSGVPHPAQHGLAEQVLFDLDVGFRAGGEDIAGDAERFRSAPERPDEEVIVAVAAAGGKIVALRFQCRVVVGGGVVRDRAAVGKTESGKGQTEGLSVARGLGAGGQQDAVHCVGSDGVPHKALEQPPGKAGPRLVDKGHDDEPEPLFEVEQPAEKRDGDAVELLPAEQGLAGIPGRVGDHMERHREKLEVAAQTVGLVVGIKLDFPGGSGRFFQPAHKALGLLIVTVDQQNVFCHILNLRNVILSAHRRIGISVKRGNETKIIIKDLHIKIHLFIKKPGSLLGERLPGRWFD